MMGSVSIVRPFLETMYDWNVSISTKKGGGLIEGVDVWYSKKGSLEHICGTQQILSKLAFLTSSCLSIKW
jgi:hypothetical protein